LHARVETATDEDDLVILLIPFHASDPPVKLVVETGMLVESSRYDLRREAILARRFARPIAHGPRRGRARRSRRSGRSGLEHDL
jgi:hypothetical protein